MTFEEKLDLALASSAGAFGLEIIKEGATYKVVGARHTQEGTGPTFEGALDVLLLRERDSIKEQIDGAERRASELRAQAERGRAFLARLP